MTPRLWMASAFHPVRVRAARLVIAVVLSGLSASSTAAVRAAAAPATDPLNLDFERAADHDARAPADWVTAGAGYDIGLDTVAPFHGRRSLRIAAHAHSPTDGFGTAGLNVALPGRIVAGHVVRLRGYVRTAAVAHGYAGLWLRVDGLGSRMLAMDNMAGRGVVGTTPWTACEVTIVVDMTATQVVLGVLHPGDGVAWFDALSITVDGRPYVPPLPEAARPSAGQIDWLRSHALTLRSATPATAPADLHALGRALGDARIVALGEGTHGTREFFQLKHRLTAELAAEHGFGAFAIEANMPEARRLNDYVLTGRGDPAALLGGLYFWTWNTPEVLALIEWMRAYNAAGRGRMEFWGFDSQVPTVAMDSVRAFVAHADPAYAAVVDSAYGQVGAAYRAYMTSTTSAEAVAAVWAREGARVLAHLEARRPALVAAARDTLAVAWAIQYARLVTQGAGALHSGASRDSSMAANVVWMLAHQPPATRAVLWAHNYHVSRANGGMGTLLAGRFGTALRVVGFATGAGQYSAWGSNGFAAFPLASPPPGSVEAALHATGLPLFAVDLRPATSDPSAAWFASPRPFRTIGAAPTDEQFAPAMVAREYDVLVYVDRTTATTELPGRRTP